MGCVKYEKYIAFFCVVIYNSFVGYAIHHADMAELADAHGSGPCE